MPTLIPIENHIIGDIFTSVMWGELQADLNYLIQSGGALASGTTITVTNEFHPITGVGTIDNISHAAPVSGQQVRLWFASALTVRNNGGGTGNIRTKTGADLAITANAVVNFSYDGTVWRETTGVIVPSYSPPVPATSLPASPTDGQEAVLTDSTATPTFAWLFKWSATASKWLFLGGSPMYSYIAATVSNTVINTFETRTGPQVTVLRAGTYQCRWGQTSAVVSTNSAVSGISINGVTTVNAAVDLTSVETSSGNPVGGGVSMEFPVPGITAGSVIAHIVKSGGLADSFAQRWLSVIPVWVT